MRDYANDLEKQLEEEKEKNKKYQEEANNVKEKEKNKKYQEGTKNVEEEEEDDNVVIVEDSENEEPLPKKTKFNQMRDYANIKKYAKYLEKQLEEEKEKNKKYQEAGDMNSSETGQIRAGGKAVKVEPASDVVDAEPSRQVEVKMEVAEELNENLAMVREKKRSRGKHPGLKNRKSMKRKKEALALLALTQATEGNKVGEDKACESTSGTKVNASTQTGEGKVGAATTTTKVDASTQTEERKVVKKEGGL
uniref:Uncharacterized protein n=1 Tax=Meloidogyne javanica TaxID=6303 RepID=A0A915N227_MELJA